MGPTNGGAYWIERRLTSIEKFAAGDRRRRLARERSGPAGDAADAGRFAWPQGLVSPAAPRRRVSASAADAAPPVT